MAARWGALLILTLLGSAACGGGARQPRTDIDTATPRQPVSVVVTPTATTAASPEQNPAACPATVRQDRFETVTTSDGERAYLVHIPARPAGEPAPVVFNFHGYGKDAKQQEAYSDLPSLADREGFIVVTPQGSGYPAQWTIAGVFEESGVDDIAFVAELLGRVRADYCIDALRVYATGMSNGAEMASQVGCVLPDSFAAIAPVAGVTYQGCEGGPMPVIAFHGTFDFNVPFETAQPAMAEWARHNGCGSDLDTLQVSERVVRESFGDCSGNDAVLYVIDGGGHTWPGSTDETGGAGPISTEINASELIWAFFQAHPKRGR